jgi:hypothetical protein
MEALVDANIPVYRAEGLRHKYTRNSAFFHTEQEVGDLFKNARIGGGTLGEQTQAIKQCMAKTTLKQKMKERLEAKKAKESKI